MTGANDLLVRAEDLSVYLPGPSGMTPVIDKVSFAVRPGRTTGLIGESGSGKTMVAMATIGLLPDTARTTGQLWLRSQELLSLSEARRRKLRGREIAMIFQDPLSALNPSQRIGRQVGEILRRGGASRKQVDRTVVDLLDQTGIPDPAERMRAYPHQFSGGMRQRAMIALALAGDPSLVLADEPTTALDVTVQARILRLLRQLQDERQMSMLLVSHDLRVMSHVSHDLVVMYAGRVCERGPTRQVLRGPRHPYTKALTESVPAVRTRSALAEPLPGAPASPLTRPSGCPFHPRCAMARDRCRVETPALREIEPGQWSACHFAEELRRSGGQSAEELRRSGGQSAEELRRSGGQSAEELRRSGEQGAEELRRSEEQGSDVQRSEEHGTESRRRTERPTTEAPRRGDAPTTGEVSP